MTPQPLRRLTGAQPVVQVAPEIGRDVRGVTAPGLGCAAFGQSSSAATACGNWSSRTYTTYPNVPRPSVTPVEA